MKTDHRTLLSVIRPHVTRRVREQIFTDRHDYLLTRIRLENDVRFMREIVQFPPNTTLYLLPKFESNRYDVSGLAFLGKTSFYQNN